MVSMEIKRLIFNELSADLSARHATILVGARQVGKTFLLRKLEKEAQKRGLKTTFFDLEQPADLIQFNREPQAIIDWLTNSGQVIFIDEFHYLKNASRLFKAIYDRPKTVKIYASGSSALEIHKHLKESLVGRKLTYRIHPCSFSEIRQVVARQTVPYFCQYGGMPGLIAFPEAEMKMKQLEETIQSYLLKDIKSLVREENITAFNNLLYLLAGRQGSLLSTDGLARDTGQSSRTIVSYLEILRQTYVGHPLTSYSRNYGNELKKSKKYYLYDLGIRNALLKNFAPFLQREDQGVLTESFVFLELVKRLGPETDLRFWRLKGGPEVDFIWIKNQQPFPIEVKTTCQKGEIPPGLIAFLNRYPRTSRAYVLSQNIDNQTTLYNGIPVFYKGIEQAAQIPEEV